MADTYDVNGVSVSPAAGGYYDLTHPSLPDGTERVQGKERADQRAGEIAAAHEAAGGGEIRSPSDGAAPGSGAGDDDGKMEPQKATLSTGQQGDAPRLPEPTTDGKVEGSADKRSSAEKAQETQAAIEGRMDNTLAGGAQRDVSSSPQARDEEMAALRAQLSDANDRADKLAAAGNKIASVLTDAPPEPAVPTLGSRKFNGSMSDDSKKLLKKAGIEVRTIVLEENENIPPTGLFIGHNGRSYVIKPGEEVEVPKFLTDVLDDAVMASPVVDSATQKILGYRNRSRYPYRVVNPKG